MHGNKGCLENERIALLEIKPFMEKATVESWVDDRVSDCCDWYRVECNTTTGRVMNLSLSGLLYESTTILNFSLFQPFEQLQILDLSFNFFQGWVDNRGNLRNLEFLDLSFNRIRGSLQQANLRNLKFLDLTDSGMNGSLQELGICKLKNLFELDLSDNNFEGHIPPCVNNLTILRALDLSSNQLTGNIPSLNLMQSIEYLSLQYNNFEGLFSFGSLANLSKLEIFKLSTEDSTLQVLETEIFLRPPKSQLKFLYLSECNLHGIPSFLMYQHSLEFIDLSHNKVVGMFPTWLLHNNTRLQSMYLINNSLSGILQLPNSTHDLLQLRISNNNLSGQLPMNIGVIHPRLVDLNLSKNSFEGYIPWSMGEMKSLNKLDLSSNNFSGELPKSFVSGCSSLELLKLSNNNFHGEIFPEFMNMTQLQWIFLDNNQFGGKIQDGLWKARFLSILDLSSNSFSGQIPDWIGNFSLLETLVLSNNSLEGGVPIHLSNLGRLSILDISENRLSGSMASSFNLSSSMVKLCLQNNALNGSIPNAFLRTTDQLLILDLSDNKFSGSIPIQIDEDPKLGVLLLGGNHLEGHIPHELCQFMFLSILDLSRNILNGTIPSCFTNILTWVEQRNATYGIPPELGGWQMTGIDNSVSSYNFTLGFEQVYSRVESNQETEIGFVSKNRYESYKGSILNYMLGIDLSSNELTGDIPTDIGNLQQIIAMNLSRNFLSGSIPESFSNLTNIESLDLSHNKLSGRIPPQLTQLNRLGTFNVSFNNLSGPVPDTGQFGTFIESSYGSNPGLCGPQIKRSCSSEPATPSNAREDQEDESAIDMVSFYWSLFASYVTTIMCFVLILWLNSDWRKLWFCFIDACIISCYCWILRNVFHSNYDVFLTRDCLGYSKVKPAVNQIETHPYFQRDSLVRFCQKHGICVTAHTPLGGAIANAKRFGSISCLDDPVLKDLAEKYKKSVVQIVLRRGIQRNTIVIPKTSSVKRLKENFNVFDFKITEEDMEIIKGVDRKHRTNHPTKAWGLDPYA
ncbi:hypothetical protein LWI29_016114 [Acer saccharum]|uniref:Leucine-rich repeat-containing N-terminal plant-type domain-containing protein n=1 Tax=Acer saccharum TaxID=4024 RepID=A0AA39RYY2_ACESA|nr:hypothetical protein LWI29_016114 [Acer saccharum]